MEPYHLHETGVVPTFLLKLVNLLNDELNHEYVNWNDTGTSFIVKDQVGFSRNVLPKYFKHNKFASFVRQLNMYGFRKITSLTQSGLKSEREEVEFYHYMFVRGQDHLLEHIKRKVTKTDDASRVHNHAEVVKVLSDVQQMKDQQDNINNKLTDLKQENEDLWREVVSLRQKHSHQQKVVNKLIQFLVNLVHQHGMGVKRKLPLMIDDGSDSATNYVPASKYSKALVMGSDKKSHSDVAHARSPTISYPASVSSSYLDNAPSVSGTSDSGPYITELIASEGVDVEESKSKDQPSVLPEIPSVANMASPPDLGFDMSEYVNPAAQSSVDDGKFPETEVSDNPRFTVEPVDMAETVTTASTPGRQTKNYTQGKIQKYIPLKRSLSQHIDTVQNNLNNIQERLANKDQVELDYSLIQELFSTSPDIMPPADIMASNGSESSVTGNELMLRTNTDDNSKLEDDLNEITQYF